MIKRAFAGIGTPWQPALDAPGCRLAGEDAALITYLCKIPLMDDISLGPMVAI